MNSLVLAYIGDAIYELYVRRYLIEKGIAKINDLQKNAIKYVSAKNQTKFLHLLFDENLLTKEEIEIVLRARNAKGHKSPKNTDIITYKLATGLEALVGYLYINNNIERLDKIMNFILE